MWEAFVVLLVIAFVYFVGRLLVMVIGGARAVRQATARGQEALRVELSALATEDIRARLLGEPYFADDLRRQSSVQQFLSRIAHGDEVALAVEYPRRTLYRMLATAEQAAGRRGRPEAVDAIHEISGLLEELARRTGADGGPRDARSKTSRSG